MVSFDPASDLRTARKLYFDSNGFGDDGGYSDKWVKLKFGPIPFRFPNTPQRVRSVRLHDLHHVATNYQTDLAGEAEIGAWEVAGSCRDHWAAWVLNLLAMTYGLFLCPNRLYRAFIRGRHSTNLYGHEFSEAMLDKTVADLRTELALDHTAGNATTSDIVAFFGWSTVAVGLGLSVVSVFLVPLGLLFQHLL